MYNDIVVTTSKKEQMKLRMAIDGPTKAGKSYTALRLAFSISPNVIAIDTEHERMSLYHHEVCDGRTWEWQKINLRPPYSLDRYSKAIDMALTTDAGVLIVDSLSHLWEGEGGVLEWQRQLGGRYADWGKVTPELNRLVEKLLSCDKHLIATMRSKMDYAQEEIEENGRKKAVVKRLGMAPVQRASIPYEFDFELSLEQSHIGTLRTRMSELDGWQGMKPGPELIPPILAWLATGELPAWKPDWPTFLKAIRNQCPTLAAGKSDKQLAPELSALIKKQFGLQGEWNPSLGDEAKLYLLQVEAERKAAADELSVPEPAVAPDIAVN